jgi:hypothetical protein
MTIGCSIQVTPQQLANATPTAANIPPDVILCTHQNTQPDQPGQLRLISGYAPIAAFSWGPGNNRIIFNIEFLKFANNRKTALAAKQLHELGWNIKA